MTTPTRPAPNVRYAQIRYGDDLRRVSLRELGDASLWLDLVVLNGLRPPYIADTASDGVLTYGDQIKIPVSVSLISASSSPSELFGTDLVVKRDRMLSVSNGDFDLVSGVQNLTQALRHHIMVEKRELAFHPDYGCYVKSLLGKVNSPTAGQLAAFYAKSAVLEDPRVSSVPSCTASVSGDSISIDGVVVSVAGRETELRVVV